VPNEKSDKSLTERLVTVMLGAFLLIALGLPGYLASYDTIEEAEKFSRVLVGLGMIMFSIVWIITLLFTVRAVVKLYSLRLEHPGWDKAFQAINATLEALQSGGYASSSTVEVDIEPILRPYFLLPITKAGLLRLSIASYFLTVYGYALLYKFIAMNYPDMFSPKPFDLVTAIYFSVVTIATVGYGDVLPLKTATKFLVSTEILVGVAYAVFFFSIIASFMREPNNL
jgi:Trk-type K+ transport system membrane component